MNLLQKMFIHQQSNSLIIGTSSAVQKSNFSGALSVKTKNPNLWIIDFGALDKMTNNSSLFNIYSPYSNIYKVRITDGSLSTVIGKGSVMVTTNLTINFVLFFVNLFYYLLSINKLTRDLNCTTKFLPTHCVFEDLDSGKMIHNAKKCAGLYLLKVNDNLEKQTQTIRVILNLF